MAILELPTRVDTSCYRYDIVLDSELFTLEFAYLSRISRWILNIFDADKNLLLAGITLHSSTDLIGRFKDSSLPKGILLCYDTEGKHKSADRDDLGSRVKLLYEEAS